MTTPRARNLSSMQDPRKFKINLEQGQPAQGQEIKRIRLKSQRSQNHETKEYKPKYANNSGKKLANQSNIAGLQINKFSAVNAFNTIGVEQA